MAVDARRRPRSLPLKSKIVFCVCVHDNELLHRASLQHAKGEDERHGREAEDADPKGEKSLSAQKIKVAKQTPKKKQSKNNYKKTIKRLPRRSP